MYTILGLMAALVTDSFGAELNGPISIWGGSIPPGDEVNETLGKIIRDVNHDPTMTRSVSFKPFQQSWSSLDEDSSLINAEWTWRVNVSDVLFPVAESESDGGTRDVTYATSTTWDFSWSEPGNISSALGDLRGPLCIATLSGADLGSGPDFPVNVTNAYTEDNTGSSSCVPVLGEDCVRALVSEDGGAIYPYTDGSICDGPTKKWTEIPECASSFGYAGSTSRSINQEVHQPSLNNSASDSGYGFHGFISENLEAPRSREYISATNQLQVLMINVNLQAGANGAVMGEPELLCMRVNTTELRDVDLDGDGVAITSEVVFEGNNGHALRCGSVWIAFLSAFLVILATC